MSIEKFRNLIEVVDANVEVNSNYADKCMDNLRPSLIWTTAQMKLCSSTPCDVLLKGSYGAAVEAVSLVSFGLVRPAILSLRSHYELSLQFLFYKDHHIEWRNISAFRSQPNLPRVIKKYLRDYFRNFEYRFKRLADVKTRSHEDCYKVLSGIAHGTAINSISTATMPEDLVESEEIVSQSVTVFLDVGEHISDIYVSSFQSNWLSLPESIRNSLEARFADKNPRDELRL